MRVGGRGVRRRSPGRGVTPIIATVLLGSMVVVLAAVLFVLVTGLTDRSTTTPPIGSTFSLGQVTESQAGSTYVYITTVQVSGSGLEWQNLLFQVQGLGGRIVTTGPVNITATNPHQNSCNQALFDFASGSWTNPTPLCPAGSTGGTAAVWPGAQLTLVSSVNLNVQSDQLVVFGKGTVSGSTSTAIP